MKYRIVITFLKMVAHLPFSVLYGLSTVIWFFVYYVIRYRRKVTWQNLQKALPERSEEALRKIERRFYRHLCDIIVETVKLLHVSDEEMASRVSVRGIELVEEAIAKHRPVFLMAGHYGNWEWAQEPPYRVKQLTFFGGLYKPLKSEVGERVMQEIRHHYQSEQIPMKQAVRRLIQMKKQCDSFLIAFIGDQRPSRYSLNYWMDFLHQDTPYMVGAEKIGEHVDAILLYLHVEKPSRGHYVMEYQPIIPAEGEENPYTVSYMRMLEKDIQAHPELWLWTHKRWKHKRPHQSN